MSQPAAARPTVTVFNATGESAGSVPLPAVCQSPIRSDVVQIVWVGISKNKRQPYAVKKYAGINYSARSWGTGRAVSRIPRVAGSGTHAAGQAAFGNMCRGGRMFGATKIWRKWHRRVNKKQRRYATCSAIAASCVTPLVQARGHKISGLKEVPLVIADATLNGIEKTKDAVALLKTLNAYDDVEAAAASKHIRAGKGKLRNRRYKMKRGPLLVYVGKPNFPRAFRNLPGLELCSVDSLNLLQLAPGSHLGRFCIWQEGAFKKLDQIYGTFSEKSTEKHNFTLPRTVLSNADLGRIINSDEIQSVVRPTKKNVKAAAKTNPLKNTEAMNALNPYAEQLRQDRREMNERRQKEKKEKTVKAARTKKSVKKARTAPFVKLQLAP